MIKQLRKKFILISIAAVASVMILLCAGVNIFNYISVSSKLDETLDEITLNHGRMPEPEEPFEPGDDAYAPEDEPDEDYESDYDNPGPAVSFNFFAGCNSRESVEKKYRSLAKLYHPDNMDGDTASLQEINAQYELAKKRFPR